MKHLPYLFLLCTVLSVLVAVGTSVALGPDRSVFYVASTELLAEEFFDADVPGIEIIPISTRVELPTSTMSLLPPPVAYLRRVSNEAPVLTGDVPVVVPVLMYHHIRPLHPQLSAKERYFTVTPEAFLAQMTDLVRAGYDPITPDDLWEALQHGTSTLPSRPILLTFDDGFRDQYTYAVPILRRLRIASTFFVVSAASERTGAMSVAQIKELDASGLVTIGANTRHHPFLTRLSKAARTKEILGSKQDLEQMLGHPVTSFAYPYGAISSAVMDEVEAARFHLGFWIQAGSRHVLSSRLRLRRIRVLDRENVVALLDGFRHATVHP